MTLSCQEERPLARAAMRPPPALIGRAPNSGLFARPARGVASSDPVPMALCWWASPEGVSMRLLCASVLAAFLSVLPLPLGGGGLLPAQIACGMFDGKFGCKTAPGGAQYGKNAAPGAKTETPDESPEGITGEQNPTDPAAGPGRTGQGTWEATPDGARPLRP